MDLTLVILAAGMGSRYGGLKQIDEFGLNGEAIIDFSIYDAIQAGFNKLVLIIRKEHQEIFDEVLVNKLRGHIDVEYAFQDLNDLPDWFELPKEREKPWGTTHALLSASSVVTSPFAIINADDFYGKEAFVKIADFLKNNDDDHKAAMMGYELKNTLTDFGTVTRGISSPDEQGYLKTIVETDGIKPENGKMVVENTDKVFPEGTLVSMNFWGFRPAIFQQMQSKFERFLKEDVAGNVKKSEALLPNDVGLLIDEGVLSVKVLSSSENWFGVTYQEDKERVSKTLQMMQKDGTYPEKLWD